MRYLLPLTVSAIGAALFFSRTSSPGAPDVLPANQAILDQTETDPVEWLRAGNAVAVYGRGPTQRIEITQTPNEHPMASKSIHGQAPMTELEQLRVLDTARNWASAIQEQIRSHLEDFDPESAADNLELGELSLDKVLLTNAEAAIQDGHYFVEDSLQVHDLFGHIVIRVPLWRGSKQMGVQVLFDPSRYPEIADAEEFLGQQKLISREIAAYRFNGLPDAERAAILERREKLLRSPERTAEDQQFLTESFPAGLQIDRTTLIARP